jgi:hypothetical protein
MATEFDHDRKPIAKRAARRSPPNNAGDPSFSEGLIVLVFMAFLSLLGLGLFGLMPR